jgi:hypothetical protein
LLTDFEVHDLTVKPETAYPGDQITVTVGVNNSGYIKGDYKVVLKRDGAKWKTEDVTLDKDASTEVSFWWVENPIGQTEKKTIDISVGDLTDSFTLVGRKRMDAFVRIATDGIVVANTNDYTWTNIKMQLDPEGISGGYVYSWHGPIAPFDSKPDNLFEVYWFQFVKDDTTFNFSTTSPQVLRITAETEWGDDIMWSGSNVNDSLFEEVLST